MGAWTRATRWGSTELPSQQDVWGGCSEEGGIGEARRFQKAEPLEHSQTPTRGLQGPKREAPGCPLTRGLVLGVQVDLWP